MLAAMSTARVETNRLAIIWVGVFILANAAFYFLSGNYFDSHREIVGGVSVLSYSPEQMMHVRITFAVLAGVVAVGGFAAGIWPRVIGHPLPVLLGACNLVAGVAAFSRELFVVGITLLVSGVLMPVLAWYSHRRSRPAWAFLIAICGVFAVVEFFGASKIRDALGV